MLKRLIIIFLFLAYSINGDDFISKLSQLTEMPPQTWIQSGDRWTFQDIAEEKRSDILAVFEEMGWFEAKHASKKHYDYAVVLGALHASVQRRITHLINTYNRGVRFDAVVFLTGKRPLHPEKESSFRGMETDMMIEVWKAASLPKDSRDLPLIVASTGLVERRKQGLLRRLLRHLDVEVDGGVPASGGGGLVNANGHGNSSSRSAVADTRAGVRSGRCGLQDEASRLLASQSGVSPSRDGSAGSHPCGSGSRRTTPGP